MNCPNWSELLSHRFDASLEEPQEWPLVQDHLAQCARCRQEASEMDPSLLFGSLEPVELPQDEVENMLAAVRTLRRSSAVAKFSDSNDSQPLQPAATVPLAAGLKPKGETTQGTNVSQGSRLSLSLAAGLLAASVLAAIWVLPLASDRVGVEPSGQVAGPSDDKGLPMAASQATDLGQVSSQSIPGSVGEVGFWPASGASDAGRFIPTMSASSGNQGLLMPAAWDHSDSLGTASVVSVPAALGAPTGLTTIEGPLADEARVYRLDDDQFSVVMVVAETFEL